MAVELVIAYLLAGQFTTGYASLDWYLEQNVYSYKQSNKSIFRVAKLAALYLLWYLNR